MNDLGYKIQNSAMNVGKNKGGKTPELSGNMIINEWSKENSNKAAMLMKGATMQGASVVYNQEQGEWYYCQILADVPNYKKDNTG